MVVRISTRLVDELRNRLYAGERQYRIALRAGIHPSTLSHLINGALPIRNQDPRVIRVGRELGLGADECFESADGRDAVA